MNYLTILFVSFFISHIPPINSKYIILFNQREVSRPIPNSVEGFWLDKPDFDTMIIVGDKIIRKSEIEIANLSLLKPNSIVYNTFSVTNAIIRFSDDSPIDTIYTDQFFRYWKINDLLYQDKKEYFKKRFAVFFDKF